MKRALIILAVILNLTFTIGTCQSQWIYQSLPAYYEVKDVKFFDANTGIIILGSTNPGMLKTTNGGNNWTLFDTTVYYYGLQTIDSVTMYAYGQRTSIYRIKRTFDRGITWDSVSVSSARMFWDFSFVNKDTGWVSGFNGGYLIWRTTNGGVTLVPQTGGIGNGIIFFLKQKVNGEYYGWQKNNDYDLWRTTNSGVNWYQITSPAWPYISYIQFADGNTGWLTGNGGIFKTTNGGSNWINQPLAPGIPGLIRNITRFKIIDKDTIYGVGAYKELSNSNVSGIIWKTTNGGLNWGYQQPDTNYPNGAYASIDFINSKTGWAYQGNGVHTTNGGGVILYPTYINNSSTEITNYDLKQNYPNPFNPSTTIEISLPKESYVKLKILDLSGKTVSWVVYDMLLYSGLHRFKIVEFEKLNLSSGIYFYQLEARDINTGKTNFTQSRKMILLK